MERALDGSFMFREDGEALLEMFKLGLSSESEMKTFSNEICFFFEEKNS